MLYKLKELYRSLQRVYEIAVCVTFLTTTWCIPVSGVKVAHLVYNPLWHLAVCIQFIYTAYGISMPYEFREQRRSLQLVYETAVCFRLFTTTWYIAVSGVEVVHLVYNAL